MIGYKVKLATGISVLAGLVLIFTGNWEGGIPVTLMALYTLYLIRLHDKLFKDVTIGGPAGPHGDAKYRVEHTPDVDEGEDVNEPT